MKIGRLPDSLLPKIAELFSFSFELRKTGTWEQWILGEDALSRYAAYDDDQVYALICVHDFETRINERWVPCAGIAGVVSSPARRGEGLVRKVMTHCLQDMNERAVPIAILGTDIPLFYEKMGFNYCDWQTEIEISTSALAKFRELGNSGNYRMFGVKEIARCADVHDRWSQLFNLSIRRTLARWNRDNFGWECAWQILLHDDGYMLIDLSVSKEKNCLSVFEWAWVTEQAYLDGLALFAGCAADFPAVRWTEKNAEHLFSYGTLEDCPKMNLSPGQMARVVNLAAYESLFHRSFDSVAVSDPLQVTAQSDPCVVLDAVPARCVLGPGQLIQLTTGFWKELPAGWPKDLERIAGSAPTFISEIF